MLEALNEIEWASVSHAYGPAEDVPDLLRNLLAEDQEVVKEAKWALFGNLWHQGTVYEASQYAVPFLLEMLGPDSNADKAWILYYLAHLATGTSYHEVHESYYSDDEAASEEFQKKKENERIDVDHAKGAVRAGIPKFMELFAHESAEVRVNATYLVSVFPPEVDQFGDALLSLAANDASDIVRVGAYFGYWSACKDDQLEPFVALCNEKIEEEQSPLVRWGLARVIAGLSKSESSPAVIDALTLGFSTPELDEQHQHSPWANDNVFALTCRSLLNLGPVAVPFLGTMKDAMYASDASSALEIAGAMLDIVFEFKPCEVESFAEMSDPQKEVLKSIAYCEPAWTYNVNTAEILRWFKLPATEADLQAFCGLPRKEIKRDIAVLGPGGNVATATLEMELEPEE